MFKKNNNQSNMEFNSFISFINVMTSILKQINSLIRSVLLFAHSVYSALSLTLAIGKAFRVQLYTRYQFSQTSFVLTS